MNTLSNGFVRLFQLASASRNRTKSFLAGAKRCLWAVAAVLALALTSGPLNAAPSKKIRLSAGNVQVMIPLTIVKPFEGKGLFRVQVPTNSLHVALILPDGTRLAKPTILTPEFAVEDPVPAGFLNAPDSPREVLFRAMRSQPAGEYRLEVFGLCPKDCTISARVEPYRREKSKGGMSGCYSDGFGPDLCGWKGILFAPLVLAAYLPDEIKYRREMKALDEGFPTHLSIVCEQRIDGFGRKYGFLGVGDRAHVRIGLNAGKVRKLEKAELDVFVAPLPPTLSRFSVQRLTPSPPQFEKLTTLNDLPHLGKRGTSTSFKPTRPGVYRFAARLEGVLDNGKRFAVSGEAPAILAVPGEAVEFLEMTESLVQESAKTQPSGWIIGTRVRVHGSGEYTIAGAFGTLFASRHCRPSKVQHLEAGEYRIEMRLGAKYVRNCLAADGPTAVVPISIHKHPIGRSLAFHPPDYSPTSRTLRLNDFAADPEDGSGIAVYPISPDDKGN